MPAARTQLVQIPQRQISWNLATPIQANFTGIVRFSDTRTKKSFYLRGIGIYLSSFQLWNRRQRRDSPMAPEQTRRPIMISRSIFSLAVSVILSSFCQAQFVETLIVPASEEAGVMSSAALELGTLYELTASGSVFIASDRVADSEYADFNSETLIRDILNNTDIGMAIDGVDIDWGAYSPDNTYTARYTGTGNPLTALFRDTLYVDNRDSLSLTITQVPEPSGANLAFVVLISCVFTRRKRG